MPGLQKEDHLNRLFPLAGKDSKARRSVQKVAVAGKGNRFRRALRQLMGTVTGTEPWTDAVLPEEVFRCSRMQLKWHGEDGKVEYQVVGWECSYHCPAVVRGATGCGRGLLGE